MTSEIVLHQFHKMLPASEVGTAYKASSLREEIIGMIMIPMTIPGDNALNPAICRKDLLQETGVITIKAKKP